MTIHNSYRIKEEILIPPYEGRSALIKAGEELVIIDVEGKQVGDFVCFSLQDPDEHVSPVHMRASLSSISLKTGDLLYSNRRRPLMQLVQDTVGKHDFFFPACDYYRYKEDFGLEDHPNCHDNLKEALAYYSLGHVHVPDPINWFMNNVLDENGDYVICEPLSKPGDFVRLKALEDVIVACSACSQDLAPVNGFHVTGLKLQILNKART
ncbi:urea carboxylase-associated family protein [Fictibacillus fluitans]|uniref:Urea carboxylase-associated family protein n=1 Tax=Fictibacillus fluitans TaxID=3058422 RepID=A0ABT8HU94_9BACL|nr:urea carboxylase-associated family protein [Fictibacillus sp. NE201]MDN4523847.1 urea carboxylase-associated family protein [Fictibacillus sp. NE201]